MNPGDIYKDGIIYSRFHDYRKYLEQTGKSSIGFEDMELILKDANAKGEHIYIDLDEDGQLFSTDCLTAEEICMKICGMTIAEHDAKQEKFKEKYLKDLKEWADEFLNDDSLKEMYEAAFGKDEDKTTPGKSGRKKEDSYLS